MSAASKREDDAFERDIEATADLPTSPERENDCKRPVNGGDVLLAALFLDRSDDRRERRRRPR